jgi:uncharacterized cupredoxin-like copper-binding protein
MFSRTFTRHPITRHLGMRRSLAVPSLIVLFAAGTALGLGEASASTGHARHATPAKATIVNVTMGKPSELRFTLSKLSNLPAGVITFKVKDAGLAFHDFKICRAPTPNYASLRTTASLKNSCTGKSTPILKPGQTATLTVTITKDGMYEFLCTLAGHAAAGMKGMLGVGMKATPLSAPVTTTPKTTTSPAKTGTTGGSTTIPGSGGGGGTAGAECPPGQTITGAALQNGGDADEDDNGGPTDGDGCV